MGNNLFGQDRGKTIYLFASGEEYILIGLGSRPSFEKKKRQLKELNEHLEQRVDEALYQAKTEGRNRVVLI